MEFRLSLDAIESLQSRSEFEKVRDIEERLCTGLVIPVEGLDYYGECRHGNTVGGDFFDFVATGDQELLFSVGDTSVKGMPGAVLTTGLRSYARAWAANSFVQLARLADKLNRMVWELAPADFYARLFCGRIDGKRRLLQYVNAGQEPALLVRRGARRVSRLENNGTVLGLSSHSLYSQRSVNVNHGDLIVAFTNGIADAAGASDEAHASIERVVLETLSLHPQATPMDMTRRILESVESCGLTGGEEDDRTAVVIRIVGAAALGAPDECARELVMAEAA